VASPRCAVPTTGWHSSIRNGDHSRPCALVVVGLPTLLREQACIADAANGISEFRS
jgi:hypothetical protein